MRFELDIKMHQSTFWHLFVLFIMLIITILVFKDDYGFLVVETYENCTCPETHFYYRDLVNSYQPIENNLWQQEVEEENSISFNKSFTLCPEGTVIKQVTCDCYEEFGCLAYCYECVNETKWMKDILIV